MIHRRHVLRTAAVGIPPTIAGCATLPFGETDDSAVDYEWKRPLPTGRFGIGREAGSPLVVAPGWDHRVLALARIDDATGDLVWGAGARREYEHEIDRYTSRRNVVSVPVLDAAAVYALTDRGYCVELNADDGTLSWEARHSTLTEPAVLDRTRGIPEPALLDSLVCVLVDVAETGAERPSVVGFHRDSGEEAFVTELPGQPAHPPVGTEDCVACAVSGGEIHAYDTSGDHLWETATDDGLVGLAVESDTIYAAGDETALYALDAADGTIRWETNGGPATAPPVVAGDEVVVATTERLEGIDAADGTRTWHEPVRSPVTNIAVTGDRVFGLSGVDQRHPLPESIHDEVPRLVIHEIPGGTLVNEVEYRLDEELPPVDVATADGACYLSRREWLSKLPQGFVEGD